jgi:hypothetical protein
MAGKGSGGGLAIGSRDADGRAFDARRYFQLADHGDAASPHSLQNIQIRWHAGRNHNQIDTLECLVRLLQNWNSQNVSHRLLVDRSNGRAPAL